MLRDSQCLRSLRSLRERDWAIAAVVALLSVSSLSGCAQKANVGEVKGTVTLDGKPLEDGTIRFTPIEGRGPLAGATIKAGEFSTTVAAGKHRVEISSTKMAGGPVDRHSNAVETVLQLIPEKYNTQSELTLDVQSGLNEPQFDLKSK
jgi:hypothetical protein